MDSRDQFNGLLDHLQAIAAGAEMFDLVIQKRIAAKAGAKATMARGRMCSDG